jgi:hypothetical protein
MNFKPRDHQKKKLKRSVAGRQSRLKAVREKGELYHLYHGMKNLLHPK